MIAREILDVNQLLGFEHVDLKCLPASFHHHPEKIAPAMDIAISEAKAEGFEHIFVGYADCGTGGLLDKVCENMALNELPGPTVFPFTWAMQSSMNTRTTTLPRFLSLIFLPGISTHS